METTHESLFGSGTTSPEQGTQENLQAMARVTQRKENSTRNSKMVTRAQKARTNYTQTSELAGKAGDRICRRKAQCGRVSCSRRGHGQTCKVSS